MNLIDTTFEYLVKKVEKQTHTPLWYKCIPKDEKSSAYHQYKTNIVYKKLCEMVVDLACKENIKLGASDELVTS